MLVRQRHGWSIGCICALFTALATACSGGNRPEMQTPVGGDDDASSVTPGEAGGTNVGGTGGSSIVFPPDDASFLGDAIDMPTCNPDSGKCIFVVPDAGPYCGNGSVDQPDEECDDGNLLPGDGCNGRCKKELHWNCPPTGGKCTSTLVCGDGIVTRPTEACDDGNTASGDGCSGDCKKVEPGYYCPTPGKTCTKLTTCGDGRVQQGEQCDDGNLVDGDGCDKNCQFEAGWRCAKGWTPYCRKMPVCGDGKVEGAEQCDDGNADSGDGCSSLCRIEASFWSCPTPGKPCVKTVKCGDGKVEDTEQCDDGNTTSFDGCSNCFIDSGWKCPVPGQKCVPSCGDGKIVPGIEDCDDGNAVSGDGCTSTCKLEPGWVCPQAGKPCHRTVCGDGVVEGTEICDRGALNGVFTGDPNNPGCSFTCTPEPKCRDASGTTHACGSVCGDGMMLGAEACDDGNTSSGDGCSSLCKVEPGFTCTTTTVDDTRPCTTSTGNCLVLPIVIRDFHGLEVTDGTASPDFFFSDAASTLVTTLEGPVHRPGCVQDQICAGLPQATLDAQGKPALASTGSSCQTCTGGSGPPPYMIYSVNSYSYWYRDKAGANKTSYQTIELGSIGNGQYQFSRLGTNALYPIDGAIWGSEPLICNNWPYTIGPSCPSGYTAHNYHFTTEVRYVFPYSGGEVLTFLGDDDVWVFLNGKLAVDLGGTHQQTSGSITVNAGNQATFGMTPGNLYEIAVFHAERCPNSSNYQLTLSGFQRKRSTCVPTCGDGVATVFEECDNGAANSDTAYAGCTKQCKFGPRCGDGIVQSQFGEECDDGKNTTTAYYTGTPTGCAPGCKLPPHCGDGKVDPGEECDDGAQNGQLGKCNTNCTVGAFCGDNIVQSALGEACDDGLNIGGYGQCDVGCKLGPRCGDGVTQAEFGETCDDGPDNGKPGKCSVSCGAQGYCGDGVVEADLGETCDDGKNDNSYGGCSPDCQYGPRCGDGALQADFGEQCDLGTDNMDGLYGGCSTTCKYGPRCGDGTIQAPYEQCDDGNNVSGDGCSANCLSEIAVPK
jgi:fibro-slime domain-containing protein